ncbi:MAG: sulfatase-like hydrolase/transferase [Verrucomicrobiota bacterium]
MRITFKLIATLFVSGVFVHSDVFAESRPPNIVLIVADDLGYGDLSCYGNEFIQTPNLDRMAREGLRFTDFHSNGAVCSPTRAALMTGRYQQRTGISGVVTAKGHRHTGLGLEEMTFAEVLKTVNYKTALIGKWHLGYKPELNPVAQGFDVYRGFVSGNVDYQIHIDQTGQEDWWKQDELVPEEGYLTDLITQHGLNFIKENSKDPFLLYLAHAAPHYPYQARADPPRYIPGVGRQEDPSSPEVLKEMIEIMDEGIGDILDQLERAGVLQDTLVIFTSDNGPASHGSSGGLRGKKGSIWEGGHRVPAIFYWPGHIRPAAVSNELTMTADLWPTFAALGGASVDHSDIDGVNLLPHLLEGVALQDRYMFWGIKKHIAVRKENYKFIVQQNFQKPKLYDLDLDIEETRNISAKHPELAESLLAVAKEWYRDVTDGIEQKTQ